MSQLRVTVAGALTLERDTNRVGHRAFTGSQLPVLSIVMLLRRDQNLPVEELADQLWRDAPPEHWRTALRGLVSRLRRVLVEVGYDEDVVVAEGGAYRASLGDVEIDVEAVPGHLSRARDLLDQGRVEEARSHASAARGVASRPVLAGIDAPILSQVRRDLARQRLDALDLIAECRVRAGEYADAATVAREALRLDPFREVSWRHLLSAHARAGNVALALRGYERMRRLFADELGADPSPQTQSLHADLLRSTASFEAAPAEDVESAEPEQRRAAAPDRAPYRGLLAFRPEDADLFFGRDAEVQEVIDRLARDRAVAVTGSSGSGKSSLVRGGLLPALAAGALPESDTWAVAVVSPGVDPLKALVAKLADMGDVGDDPVGRLLVHDDALAGLARSVLRSRGAATTARLLVVVDQAEELFTVCQDDARRKRFVAALLEATRGRDPLVRVALTLRADFLPQATAVPELAALLSTSHYVLVPLDGVGYEAAIVGPARTVGVELEAGLVGRILADVAGEPGALPLMEHALLEVWDRREDGHLTLAAYDEIGGVAGALANRAEEVYGGLDGDQQAVVRRVLLRAVHPGDGTGDTRRSVSLAELRRDAAGAEVVDVVVGRLVEARLLTTAVDPTGEPVVEVAHEALIVGWPRLAAWIADTREDLLAHERLAEATTEWEANDRAEGFLLRGGRLVQHETWTPTTTLHLAPAEQELLTASRRRADEQEQSRRRRQRLTTMTVGAAAVVALVLAGFAWNARTEAANERDNAQARRLLSSSREVRTDDPELSLLLAMEAAEHLPADPEVAAALHGAAAANRTILSLAWPDDESGNTQVDMTSDGTTLAWGGQPGNTVEVRDIDSGVVDWHHEFDVEHGTDLVLAFRFVNDDTELAVAVQFSPLDPDRARAPPPDAVGVHVFDAATGELRRSLPTSACGAWIAGAGRIWAAIVSIEADGYLLWNEYTDEMIAEHGCHQLGDIPAEIDVVRVDVQSGERDTVVARAQSVPAHLFSALSRDGRIAAVDPFTGPRVVIDVDSGQTLLELPRPGPQAPVALSPDGSLVAFSADDAANRSTIYDVATGAVVATTAGHASGSGMLMVRFSRDGRWLYSTSRDGTLRTWDVETGKELDRISGFHAAAVEPRLSLDRTRMVTSTFSRDVRAFDVTAGGRPEVRLPEFCAREGATPYWYPAGLVVGIGHVLAHVGCEGPTTPGRAIVVDLDSGGTRSDVPALGLLAALSADGSLVATQEWSSDGEAIPGGQVVVREAATGSLVAEIEGLCAWDWAVSVGDLTDGTLIADRRGQGLDPDCRDAPETPFAGFNEGMWISPDNRYVAVGAETATGPWIVVSEIASGAVRAVLPGDDVAFAPDRGELFVVELATRRLSAYDLEDFTLLRDGTRPDSDFFIELHYVEDRGELIARSGGTGGARIFRFDADTLDLVADVTEVHESQLHTLDVRAPAGLIATGSADGRARVWDLDTFELVHEVVVGDGLKAVALSDDGGVLYTLTASGQVRGWMLDPDELLEYAQARVTRDFSPEECARYFPGSTCPGTAE